MTILLQLIRREFGLFWQNKVLVSAFLLMSLLLAAIVGFTYRKGQATKQNIIVIDKDHSPSSALLIDMLEEDQTLYVKEVAFETVGLPQLMLDKKATAIVIIPYRFEESILSGKKPEINCYLNLSNTLQANLVRVAIQSCTSTMNTDLQIALLEKKGLPHSVAAAHYESVHHNVFQEFNRAGNYLLFLWPGMILGIFQQLLLIVTAIGFSQEVANNNFNKDGLLKYSRSAAKLILAKIFPYLFMSLWILGADYLMAIYFGMMPPEHPWLLLLSTLLMVAGACMMGTLFSILIPLPIKATQVLMSFAAPAITLSGFTWPTEYIPSVLNMVGDIIPLTPFLKALQLIWIEGASLNEVLPEINHQLILIAVYSLLSILLLKKKIKKAYQVETKNTALA